MSLGGAVQDHILLSFVITQHYYHTMFENHRKSLIQLQHCDRSELSLHFEKTKGKNIPSQFGEFWKLEACGQTELPDRSILIGQKSGENAKI